MSPLLFDGKVPEVARVDAQTLAILQSIALSEHHGLLYFSPQGELLFSSEHGESLLGVPAKSLTWQALLEQECPWQTLIESMPQETITPQGIIARWRLTPEQGLLVTLEAPQDTPLVQALKRYPLALIRLNPHPTPLNDHAVELLGQTSELLKLRWSIQNPYQESAPVASPLVPSSKVRGEDIFMIQRAGHHTSFVRVYALTDHTDTGQLFAVEDISQQHQRELLKEELLSVASHELRNPLTPLKGLLQLAMQQHEEDKEVDFSLLQKAEAQVSRLVKLANTLLDVSRLESGRLDLQLERHDLVSTLEDLLAVWLMRYGQDRFQLSLPSTPCMVKLDLAAFEQVLSNILDNAIKYSPSHETIFITLRTLAGQCELLVEDRGVGIEKHKLPMLFKRFYQGESSRRHRGGLGLGLYICQKIMKEHSGAIFIESDKGGPTIVHVQLPCTPL